MSYVNRENLVRVCLVQMRYEKGAISENREQIAAYIAEAAQREIDIFGAIGRAGSHGSAENDPGLLWRRVWWSHLSRQFRADF